QNAVGVFGRCLRLSEAYLNYAEAMAMRGEEFADEATTALNALREKRFDPEDFEAEEFDSQEELVQFIRDERRRELCFEGHRWFDLRRWGMPSFTHKWHHSKESTSTYRLEEGDLLYTVPIPDEALQSNGELVQNELPGKRTPIE
ncbi:MAG: RagB/SusD family nutrient uptake outer membrane protein, partial [Bacteroidaceae bacterium]|nr:RagB/SusD family nutrient uptake outer membrane protein [Bacteroidaceae bacterium]